MHIDQIENSEEKQENPERIEDFEEKSGDQDSILNSIVDVSGKRLDFPLINGAESTMTEVYLYKNELNLIPSTVGRLKGLKTLKFFGNELNLFPREFGNLTELECLQMKVTVPGISGLEFSKLGNLKELELSRVPPRSSALPILSEIAGLKCLTRLSVCHFSIRYLPPEIACLKNLEHLDLSFNKIRSLPDEITFLSVLISLKVTNNKLVELPLGLNNLQRLENLDASNNLLVSLECVDFESMHNLQTLNLQHNQLRGCQIPSWISCNWDGNIRNVSNDEAADMDVYEAVTKDIHCSRSPVAPSSHSGGLLSNNRCLAARRAKAWKRRHILQTKARQELLNNCRKLKVDVTCQTASGKCMMCKVSDHNDETPSEEDSSIVVDAEHDDKNIFAEGEVHETPPISINENLTAKEGSKDGCSCADIELEGSQSNAIESEGSQSHAIESEGSQSNEISSSLSDDVEVLDEGSSSEALNCVPKSKRHSEEELDNPKPTKSLRPANDPSHMSCQYSEISFCGIRDCLPDGFYDAGRDRPFLPLTSYEEKLHVNSREVILLDREKDEVLDTILLSAQALVSQFRQRKSSMGKQRDFAISDLQTAFLLALFVSDHFGGSDKSSIIQKMRKAVSGANCSRPFVCTCATGASGNKVDTKNGDTVEDLVFADMFEKSLQSIKERRHSIIVPIGALEFGVCRHRALLLKYICDHMEPRIPCELVRGYLDFSPHAWNVITIKRDNSLIRMIVDACHPHDIREENDPEYFNRYIPLSRVRGHIADRDASPNHSFPSLSECDEVEKLTSTSLMHCNVGSLEVAVKVRTIDVSSASADEVRNFELSLLGEVRILSALKHSCIVEFYGHRISSKWRFTPDGKPGGRTLKSAILMEYIRGGSLKSYLGKLSSDGEKHVPLDLTLSIARDVASALVELHAKHIIHRDIKSENILIDLEKKQQDGSPVVKMCDFDFAVPLHSYLHRCCIAHAGIPPPDICVGTPRWMAPEVFRAMHKRDLYGLEVDIWSFGCLLLELLTLQIPYSELPESEIHRNLLMGEGPKLTDELEALAKSEDGDEPEPETESETLKFLVKLYHRCTENNPSDRPSAEEIYNVLVSRANPKE